MKKYLFIILSVLFVLPLFGCGENTSLTLPSQEDTPEVSLSGEVTVTAAPSPTAVAAPTSTVEPTPTVDLEAVTKAEINQRIQDFFSAEGDYSDEALNQILISKEPVTAHRGNTTDLGLLDPAMVQGILIDARQKDDSLLLTMGLKDYDGVRFISCMRLPDYFYATENDGVYLVNFTENYAWAPRAREELLNDIDDILVKLENLKGKPISVLPIPNIDEIVWSENVIDNDVRELNELIKQAADNNKMLFYMIWKNEITPQENLSNVNKDIILPDIKTADDIEKVNLDNIPIFAGNFYYFTE